MTKFFIESVATTEFLKDQFEVTKRALEEAYAALRAFDNAQRAAFSKGAARAGERIALAVRDERSDARLFVVHGASLESGSFEV